jgi:hypothetical protein
MIRLDELDRDEARIKREIKINKFDKNTGKGK